MGVSTTEQVALQSADDIALADKLREGRTEILAELHKLIIGQEDVIEQALISLFAGGNCLLIGVPGLAKTLLIHTLAIFDSILVSPSLDSVRIKFGTFKGRSSNTMYDSG